MDPLEDFVQQYIESVAADQDNNFLVDSQYAEADATPDNSEQRSTPQAPQAEPEEPTEDLHDLSTESGPETQIEEAVEDDNEESTVEAAVTEDSEPAEPVTTEPDVAEDATVEEAYQEEAEPADVAEPFQEDSEPSSPDDLYSEDGDEAVLEETQEEDPLPYQEYQIGDGDTVVMPNDADPEIKAMLDFGTTRVNFSAEAHIEAIPELPDYHDFGHVNNMGDVADTMLAGLPFTGLLEDRR